MGRDFVLCTLYFVLIKVLLDMVKVIPFHSF